MLSRVAFWFLFASFSCARAQSDAFDVAFQNGTAALRGGNLDTAASEFSKAIQARPRSAQSYFNLGLVRLQQNLPDEASRAFGKSVELNRDLRGASLFLGISLYRLDKYRDAAAALQRAVEAEPSNFEAQMWLGIAELASGDASPAVTHLENASKLKPSDPDVLYHLGRAYMQMSKETYEKLYQADPNSWRVHQVLAQSFEEADRMEDAEKECRAAIALKPHERGLHQQLGDIFWKQNHLDEAEAEFQSELQADPENLTAMYKLAAVSTERAKPQAAVDLLTKVLAEHPDLREAHYQLGRAEAQLGNNDSAIQHFMAVVNLTTPVEPEIIRQSYYQLSQLYRRSQRPEESRLALNSFIKLKQEADAQNETKLQDKLKRTTEPQAQ